MRVTFDSHVWQLVVRPDKHSKDKAHSQLLKINEALRDGRVQGFICETVGTLEAISTDRRGDYLAKMRPITDVQVKADGNQIGVHFAIRPDDSRHLGLPLVLKDRLQEATTLGIRLLPAERLGMPRPSFFLRPNLYAQVVNDSEADARLERFGHALESIEARGVGAAAVRRIGERIYKRIKRHWIPRGGVSRVPDSFQLWMLGQAKGAEIAEVAKAFAEWADGDSIAAHIAFENDFFCSEDQGKTAGGCSVLDPINRAWLKVAYEVKFVTISELAGQL
jgi:hypothetical protein